MEIQKNKYYLTRSMKIVQNIGICDNTISDNYYYIMKFLDSSSTIFISKNGKFFKNTIHKYDLIKEISPDKNPEYFI